MVAPRSKPDHVQPIVIVLLLQLLLAVTAKHADAAATPGPRPQDVINAGPRVINLSVFDLQASLSDGRMWFVEYYVPFCRACKRMADQWSLLSDMVADMHHIAIARDEPVWIIQEGTQGHELKRFDCTSGPGSEQLCEKMGVEHTPTLLLYQGGKELFNYKADYYHTEMMYPFITKIWKEHHPEPHADALEPEGDGHTTQTWQTGGLRRQAEDWQDL